MVLGELVKFRHMSDFYSEVLGPILSSIDKYPERNAFVINGREFNYRQFGECVSRIRCALHGRKIKGQIVGLVINDDLETYSSVVALWLEGKAYLPLHPNWPIERVADIIDQVQVDVVLDSSSSTRYDGGLVLKTHETERLWSLSLNKDTPDTELAYVLFTSGSTGKPKGVPIMRLNLAAFMDSFWKTGIDINCEDRCLQCFDLTFDVSVQGYLVPLTRGACCYTVPYGEMKYVYVGSLIEEQRLTFGAMAPSMLRYLKPYFDEMDATSLRYCILTAEACPLSLMDEWRRCATNVTLYDFYGPTESTIYCTCYKLGGDGSDKSLNGIISIGKPLANVTAIIVDDNLELVERGEKGELCVAGDQVTPGYWKNDIQNEKSFFIKDIDGEARRFYRTGDLCYSDEEGDIMYSGRIDQQAKIQGFRVELGEIEYHARQFLGGINVVCVAFTNTQGLTEIAMFVEAKAFDLTGTMDYLHSKMPSYMIPTRTIFLDRFPLNANDKIDRKKLREILND